MILHNRKTFNLGFVDCAKEMKRILDLMRNHTGMSCSRVRKLSDEQLASLSLESEQAA
jgi:hypothetical protein